MVKISAYILNVDFCFVTCIIVMTVVMTMQMGIFANISTVYTLYNTINSKMPGIIVMNTSQPWCIILLMKNLQKIPQLVMMITYIYKLLINL